MDQRIRKKSSFWQPLLKLRSSLPALVIESVLITFGVLLAFAIDNWNNEKKVRSNTHTVLLNLKNEVISNRGIILEWLSYHDSLLVRFNEELSDKATVWQYAGKESLNALYPEPLISYLLQETAWQTAHSTQAMRHFQYRTTYNLTHCYESQEEIDRQLDFIFTKLHTQYGAGVQELRQFKSLYSELSTQEHYLLNVYRDALIEIDRELISYEK